MTEKTINNIRNYLKSVEEEQKQIEEREKLLTKVDEKPDAEEPAASKTKADSEESVVPEKAVEETVEPGENVESSQPVEEEEKMPDEVEFAEDLLNKTEIVLKRYSSAYINQNIENSQLMLEFLQKTFLLLPYNTEFKLREKIEGNIANFKRLVDAISSSKAKADNKKVLEDYLQDVDKALRRYSKLQIEKGHEKAQYEYNMLLERKKKLPVGNPTYEMVVSKRLSEFEKRIREVTNQINAKKECEVIELHIKNFLGRSEKSDFETLYGEYKQLIEEYRILEEKMDKNEIASVKNSLYRCKEKLEKIKSKSQKELRKKHVQEEQKKKEEYLGIRTFWNEYITDLRLFVETLKTASPNQYFTLYEKYSGMLEVFYNLVRNDMISKEESQQATHILEYLETELETLRKNI
ncbi:MAG TPA: hypothetical protein PK718_03270 [Candidatus Methanofastidiosa archaeon]|nr:hypothetical protein [Candidatus Methanofastidiosa archaeon]